MPVSTGDEQFVLCFIDRDGHRAWFTTQLLAAQTGDDWEDVPWEHNAGQPYAWYEGRGVPPYRLLDLYFDSPLSTPGTWMMNSPYSVDAINRREVPWLGPDPYGGCPNVRIWAGTPLLDFIETILEIDGTIYATRQGWQEIDRAVEKAGA